MSLNSLIGIPNQDAYNNTSYQYAINGIKNSFPLLDDIFTNDFFILVDDEKIKTNILFASFISPTIAKNILSDKLVSSFQIKIDSYFDDFDQYCEFLTSFVNSSFLPQIKEQFRRQASKTSFKAMVIEKLNEIFQMTKQGEISSFIFKMTNLFQKDQVSEIILDYFVFVKIFISFGNEFVVHLLTQSFFQLFNQNVPVSNNDELIKKIKIKEIISNGAIDINLFQDEIEYIRQNFLEINPENLNEISEIIINEAISSDSFQIPDEDSFFNQIMSLKYEYQQYFLRYVSFPNLSYSALGAFLNMYTFDDINENIWSSLVTRLLLPQDANSLSYHMQSMNKTFEYKKGNEFSGIFNYLNQACKGNAHLKEAIEITSNGDLFNNCYNIIDKDFDSFFYPKGSPGSFILINFKTYKVSLSQYALKSNQNLTNKLVNWEISGSNDLNNWSLIDERHIAAWNGSYFVDVYSTVNKTAYQYFIIKLKGSDSSNENFLDLSSVEFFGTIFAV